jgi:glycosyltransferase involved in cell wall biosynthesis
MPNARVSVLMLTFDRPQFVDRAIESILSQTFTDWELLVIHDGPNEQIASIMNSWTARDQRIRYFRRGKVGNIADAMDYGMERADGDYLAILDDDDYWATPDKLEQQVNFLDANPDHVGCGGGLIVLDQSGAERLRYLKPLSDEDIKKHALFANPMANSTTVFRREAARRVGFYDVSLSGFQDWDFWLKMGLIGKLANFPDHLAFYQFWEGGGSFQQQRANTVSSMRIVWRHRQHYVGFPVALTMCLLHYGYARMPRFLHHASYGFLSRLKKAIFSSHQQPALSSGAGHHKPTDSAR